jgi:HK97 family phage major capsid protein
MRASRLHVGFKMQARRLHHNRKIRPQFTTHRGTRMFIQLKQPFNGKPIGERIDVSQDHADVLIKRGIAEAVQGDPLNDLVQRQVGGMLESLTKGLNDTITETLKQFAKAQSKSNKNGLPEIFGAGQTGDSRYSFGDFCLAVATKNLRRLEDVYNAHTVDPKGNIIGKAAMAEGSGTVGGYIVPPDFARQLLAVVSERALIRSRAFVQPMASATLQFPYLDITTAQSAGVSPFFGGVQMYWTEEAQTRTETEPAFKMMELKAHELSGYSVSSNILIQDAAFGLEKFLMQLFSQAIAWFEDYAFLQGNGVGKPTGMLNAGAALTYTRAGGAGNASVAFGDVAGMWSNLLPYSWNNAIWLFSPSVVPQLLQLKDGANRAIFISVDQGAVKQPTWALLGRPAIPTEKLPALGGTGDLFLIDPQFYVIGDRMQIEIAASEHVNFLKNQMTWRVVERVDGSPWLDKPITLQDATTKVSPFVALK